MTGLFPVLLLIVGTYLIFGVGYAVMTPKWQNPDEPAHYNYIRQMASIGHLPVMGTTSNHAYLEELVRRGFPPELPIDPLRYENHQPPLYYLLALPVYLLANKVLVLRLFSLLLGTGLIVFTYLAGRTVLPDNPVVACGAAAFSALLPQNIAIMASINNDALAEPLMALVLFLALREALGLSRSHSERMLLGLVVGLALLCKLTVAISYPVAVFALLMRLHRERPTLSSCRLDFLLIAGLPLLIALPWWLRNLSLYGWPDFFGLIRHGIACAAEPQTGDWIASHGFASWLHRFLVFTFQSFWGQFGWMAVPMRPAVYQILLIFCGLLTAGLLLGRSRVQGQSGTVEQATVLLLFSTCLTLFAYLWYNIHFVQHQGRYLYSALVPISLAAAFGWRGLFGRLGDRYPLLSFLGLYGFLSLLNLYALFCVIRPHQW